MTANAHTGKEGLDGMGVSSRGAGGFDGLTWGNQIGSPLSLRALDGWEISPVVTPGHEGCRIFPHPKNFVSLLSMAGSGAQGVMGMLAGMVSGL